MLNELAHFSLNIALGFAVLGTIIPLLGATLRRSSWMQLASVFALLQFGGAQLPYTQADDL
jgi:cytochrome c biogenesis factor